MPCGANRRLRSFGSPNTDQPPVSSGARCGLSSFRGRRGVNVRSECFLPDQWEYLIRGLPHEIRSRLRIGVLLRRGLCQKLFCCPNFIPHASLSFMNGPSYLEGSSRNNHPRSARPLANARGSESGSEPRPFASGLNGYFITDPEGDAICQPAHFGPDDMPREYSTRLNMGSLMSGEHRRHLF